MERQLPLPGGWVEAAEERPKGEGRRLGPSPGQWELDERTREVGRRGISQARAALARASRTPASEAA